MRKLLTLLTILASTANINAQITYHDISPDTTVSTWDAFQIKPSTVTSNDITIWWHPVPEVVVQTHGNCEVLFDNGSTLPSKLEMGDTVTASGNWKNGNYDTLNGVGVGNWKTDASDKYLGFRFKNSTSSWYYGWLLMSVGSGASSFTVSEWAYNTVAGQPIKAGQADLVGITTTRRPHIEIKTTDRSIQFSGLEAGLNYTVSITDMNGRHIHTTTVKANEEMDLSSYSKDIYVVSLATNGFIYNFKVPLL